MTAIPCPSWTCRPWPCRARTTSSPPRRRAGPSPPGPPAHGGRRPPPPATARSGRKATPSTPLWLRSPPGCPADVAAAWSRPFEVVAELPVRHPVRRDILALVQPGTVGPCLVDFHGREVLDERGSEQVLGECGGA